MPIDYRQARLAFLRAAQNPDGGWGYFPQKQSWLEPTFYSLLALHRARNSSDAWQRGWTLVRSWQLPDGGWRPASQIGGATWVTALSVTLHCIKGAYDDSFQAGVRWLLNTSGVEGSLFERVINFVKPLPVEYDRRWKGWPWRPENTSWIEPTAHSLLALKKAAPRTAAADWRQRVEVGERMIADRRTPDGGWNYGNRRVLGEDLPSYPETTAVALLGLQGSHALDLKAALEVATRHWRETASPLAKAWLGITLRNYGVDLPPPPPEPVRGNDVLLASLECLAMPGGGHDLLKPEFRA